VVAAVLGCPARPALAHNVDGKLGLGFEETLTAVGNRFDASQPGTGQADLRAAGVAVRYYIGNIGIEGIVSAGLHLPGSFRGDDGNTVKTSTDPGAEITGFLSLGGLYNLFRAPSVNLAVGARVLLGYSRFNRQVKDNTTGVPVQDGDGFRIESHSRFGLTLELPLRVEFFFSPAFAIAGAVGPVISVNGDEANPLTGGRDSVDVGLTRGDFSGGLGFAYYF